MMKKLFLVFLCFGLLVFGSIGFSKIIEVPDAIAWMPLPLVGGSTPVVDYDLEETFDTVSYDLGECGSGNCWTETGTVEADDSTAATRRGGSGYSLQISLSSSEYYSTLSFASSQSNIELTVWVYITTLPTAFAKQMIIIFDTNTTYAGDANEWNILIDYDSDNSCVEWGVGPGETRMYGDWDDSNSWSGKFLKLFIDFNKGAASSISVYDTNGTTLIGTVTSTATYHPANTDIAAIHFGAREAFGSPDINYEDIGIDFQ